MHDKYPELPTATVRNPSRGPSLIRKYALASATAGGDACERLAVIFAL